MQHQLEANFLPGVTLHHKFFALFFLPRLNFIKKQASVTVKILSQSGLIEIKSAQLAHNCSGAAK